MLIGGVILVGCGKVGPPIPPEYVGVGPLVERERLRAEQAKKAQDKARTFSAEEATREPTPSVEGVPLPPLQPGGVP